MLFLFLFFFFVEGNYIQLKLEKYLLINSISKGRNWKLCVVCNRIMELSIPREFLVEDEKKDVRILQWNILADGKRNLGHVAKKIFRRTLLMDSFSSKVVYYGDLQLHEKLV